MLKIGNLYLSIVLPNRLFLSQNFNSKLKCILTLVHVTWLGLRKWLRQERPDHTRQNSV